MDSAYLLAVHTVCMDLPGDDGGVAVVVLGEILLAGLFL